MEEAVQTPINGKRKKAAAVFALLGIVAVVSAFLYVRHKATHISTDDAFIDGPVHVIASKVPGTIKNVAVSDNQFVHAGDLLAEIDATDYGVQKAEAGASLKVEEAKKAEAREGVRVAKQQLIELGAQAKAARAGLEMQEASLRQAEKDLKRADALLAKEAISRERHEKAKTGYDVATASVKAAAERVAQAEASLETQKAVISRAESSISSQDAQIRRRAASLKNAELQVGYTRIVAPVDGYVTRKSVQKGNQVQQGQPLMALVPGRELWVTANYKETQLGKVRPGQKVDIRVDTFGSRTFHGKVDSVMAGTGAAFSLFPPENATGNFVKVVQRVPVKIVLEKGADPDKLLRVGMSAVPTIIVSQ